jgi:hypothetical protein
MQAVYIPAVVLAIFLYFAAGAYFAGRWSRVIPSAIDDPLPFAMGFFWPGCLVLEAIIRGICLMWRALTPLFERGRARRPDVNLPRARVVK